MWVPDRLKLDPLEILPNDIMAEILRRLQNSDIKNLREINRSWRQGINNLVYQIPRIAQIPSTKSLWIGAARSKCGTILLSQYTDNRREVYMRMFRFSESDFPVDSKVVASEAGLLCIETECRSSLSLVSSTLPPDDDVEALAMGCKFLTPNPGRNLIVCNPFLMDFRIMPRFEQPISSMHTNIALSVNKGTLSYEVIVASPEVNVQVFESSTRVWTSRGKPPEGILFSGEKVAVTYKKFVYFVAYTRLDLPTPTCGKHWFIMSYDTENDVWERLPDVPNVHNQRRRRVCHHSRLPDLVASWNGVLLVADNDQQSYKHIFLLNREAGYWFLVFHVPIPSYFASNPVAITCIGIQMTLFFSLPNSFPVWEVDMGSKQCVWCFPHYSSNEQQMRRYTESGATKMRVAFEPSLHPASEPEQL